MYNGVFLSCSGSSIYTTLGTLKRMDKMLKNIVIWNVMGNASLILFFKCLGISYDRMVDELNELKLVINMYNYSSLLIENENEKLKYIEKWLLEYLNDSYLNKDSNLQDIYKKTGFFTCFIVWDSTNKRIININPKTHPGYKFIDCVLCCLCGIGLFKHYKLQNLVIKNIFAVDPYPIDSLFKLEDKEVNYLNILNKNQVSNEDKTSLGPLTDIENSLIEEQLDRLCKIKIVNKDNTLVLYSKLLRTHSIDELYNLYELGKRMCDTFLEGKSTFERYKNEIENIEGQE